MSTEALITQILLKRPEISREKLIEKLDREKKKTGSLISDEVLLRMIAAKLGIKIPNNEVAAPMLSIEDLIPGLSNISVVGRVIAIFSPKAFEGKRSGKLASLLIADYSGILRVVLWNSKTSLVEPGKIEIGHIIRLLHGYTREDHNGKVELHIGEKGDVDINPQGIDAKYYATGLAATKIREVTQAHTNKRVNVAGTVKELFAPSDFQRRDSSSGRVMRLVLEDKTGDMPVVVWNEKVNELEKTLKQGMKLQIINAKAKKSLSEKLEIHVDSGTYVEAEILEEKFLKIADLREGLSYINVEGEIANRPLLREVKTAKGELVKLTLFELRDETGKIWVSTWRKHAERAYAFVVGNNIQIKNAFVRKSFDDQLELSTQNTSSIILL